jgi:hypothetical protein
MSLAWHRASFPFLVGALAGLLLGAAHGAVLLTFFGFWGGFMWLLAVTGPASLWYATRRQRAAVEALSLALGLALGLLPWAIRDWASRAGLNGDEIWFPVVLAFLLGLTLGPLLTIIRRSRSGVAAT